MDLITLLLVVLLVALILTLPQWPYTRRYEWGYWPSGLMLIVLVILLIYLLVPAGRFAIR